MNKKALCLTLSLTLIGLVTVPAVAANALLNPGFEEGYETFWTRNAGTLNGQGLGEEAHSGSKSWHGAWNNAGSAQTTTYYQDVPVLPGAVCNASMWCKANAWGGIYGNDTHSFRLRIRFRDAAGTNIETWDATSTPDDTWQQPTITNKTAPAGTVVCRVMFSYITTQMANAWKVWNIDDIEFDAGNDGEQPIVTGITPYLIANNLNNTSATVTGLRLIGATTVKLVQGATELIGGNVVVAGDGLSLTADFPTAGAPYGSYNVVVEKTGYAPSFLNNAFRIRDPSASLLVNGGFEEGTPGSDTAAIPGWTRYNSDWGGGMTNSRIDSGGWIHNPKLGGVETYVIEGTYSFRTGEWYNDGGEGGLVQQVPVVPGEQLVLSWWWAGGYMEPQFAIEVGVLKGAYTTAWNYYGPDNLGLVRVDNFPPQSYDWDDASLTFTVPAGVTTVTVYNKIWNSGPNQAIALWMDDMKLLAPSCPNQHTVTGFNPSMTDPVSEFDLTLTGTYLDQVTSIRLGRGLDQYPGTITAQSSGSLTAHFAPPPEGMTLGFYDIITEQTGCLGQIQSQVFEVGCGMYSLTGVVPNAFVKPQGIVELTVNGTNVDKLAEVKLVRMLEPRNPPGDRAPYWEPESTIVGTVVDATNPDAVVMAFDLHNAQAGNYKLVGTAGACAPTVENALSLALPIGDDIVVDGGFEDASSAWVLTPDEGNTDKGDPMPGAAIAYTNWVGQGDPGNYGYPKISGIDPPYTGDEVHYARSGNYLAGCYSFAYGSDDEILNWSTWVSPNNGKVSQSLGLPNGPGNYELVLTYWVRFWDQDWPGGSLKASIIVDSVEASSTTIAFPEYGKASQDGYDPYTQLSVDFIGAATSDITIEFYFQTVGGTGADSSATTAIVIDDVAVFGALACGDPFADADKDGDVDQTDFAIAQACYTGSGGDVSDECRCFDRKDSPGSLPDGDVDNTDMAAFEACASGPGIPADPTCDDDN